MLQHAGSSTAASQQQIQREKVRQDTIVEYFTKNWLMMLSGLVLEGVKQADAISLVRSFAADFHLEDWEQVDLHSEKSLHELFVAQAAAQHEMICFVREKDGDCEAEWGKLLHDTLTAISAMSAKLVQMMVGRRAEERALSTSEQGSTDPKLLELAEGILHTSMKLSVANGEDQDAVKQITADSMARLAQMDDHSLLEYADYSKADLSMAFATLNLQSTCLVTTGSCSEHLHRIIVEWTNLSSGGAAIALLQAGVRPVVQVVMKIMGLPEFPEETATERNAARKAYLAQRKLERL